MLITINNTGVSPFAYHEGMELVREPEGKNSTYEYYRKCVTSGVISDLKNSILTLVYRYSYLNKNMICRLLKGDGRKISDAVAWLVRHGLLIRYHCTYGSRYTPYFYGAGSGVETYMYRNRIETTPHLPDAASAAFLLCRNQFICAERESGRFIEDCLHTMIPVDNGRKELDVGYSAVISSSSVPRIRVICVPVRRGEDFGETSTRIRLAQCRREQRGFSVPVCVCEDIIHIDELGSAIRADGQLRDSFLLFCTDVHTFGEEINSHLMGRDMSDPDSDIDEISLK